VKIHLDTNLLIQEPRWELLPAGDHRLFVSAIVFAEFSEGTTHAVTEIADRARLDLVRFRKTYGTGLPFGQTEADVYRELCGVVTAGGRSPGAHRRVDLMIAAVAVSNGAALASRNIADFAGLETVLQIVEL
jgi:predicted nucleic acid-binding protein